MAVENYFGVGPRLINGKFRRVRSMTMFKVGHGDSEKRFNGQYNRLPLASTATINLLEGDI
ncbi:MAG: hypothetical protein QG646_4616 [Euryarchaeota archaeon]|nr:hypothetical protein [Euryarchaeota archaeon]